MFCKNCGTKNDPDKKFCKSCGTPLGKVNKQNDPKMDEEEKLSTEPSLKSSLSISNDTEQPEETKEQEQQADATHTPKEEKIPETIAHTTLNKGQDTNNNQPLKTATAKKPAKKMKRSNKILLSLVAVIVLLLFGTYKYAENYFSYENQRDRHIEAIKTQDAKIYSDVFVSNHPGFDVTETSIQPLVDYFKEKPEGYNDILRQLQRPVHSFSDYDMIYLRQSGKHYGLFERYQLVVTPVEFYIMTSLEDVVFTYGEIEAHVTGDYPTLHVGPVSPGMQHVSVKSTIAGTDVERAYSEEVLYLDQGGYIPEIFVEFDTFSFTVNTDVDAANIYLNDQLLGEVTNNEAELGPVLWEEGLVARFETTLDTGEVVEKEIVLDPNTGYYHVQVFPDISSYDINSMLTSMYRSASSLAEEETDESLEEVASHLLNGQDNELFSTYKNTGERYRNNEDITGVYYQVYLTDYDLVDLTTIDVTYELSVREYGSDGSSFNLTFDGRVKFTEDATYLLESASLVNE